MSNFVWFFLLLAMVLAAAPGAVEITQHVIILEPSEKELAVTESFFYSNKGESAVQDPNGAALRLSIPDAASQTVQVTETGPNSPPVQRTAVKAGRANTYLVDFPIRPGETRIDVIYRLAFSSPGKFATRLLQKATQTRLVAPSGVEIKGDGLGLLGVEPRSRAQVYEVKADAIEVVVQGAGALRSAEAASEDEDSGPGIQAILPRLYDRVYVVVGLAAAILVLGFALLYRRHS